jgi:hypothetical protein
MEGLPLTVELIPCDLFPILVPLINNITPVLELKILFLVDYPAALTHCDEPIDNDVMNKCYGASLQANLRMLS